MNLIPSRPPLPRFLILISLICLAAVWFSAPPTASAEKPWIIDTHTHFKGPEQIAFESERQKRHPKDTLGHVVRAEDYRALADRLKIQSTVIVEAVDQDQPSFNDWVLQQAQSNLVCGYVARGDLRSEDFGKHYARYKESGYLKGYRFRFDELHGYLDDARARKNLKMLERDQMVVDLLVEPPHAKDVVRLASEYPRLKIVINHCFRARMKDGKVSEQWKQAIRACAKHDNVFCKLSSILNFSEAKPFADPAPSNLTHYLPVLEPCFQAFGEDRVIFATNWGVCGHFGNVDDVVRIADEFFKSKGQGAYKKAMRENALKFYRIQAKHLR